ncbi:hypothetical protein Z517_06485 [Fonsecaea pedrosoi CBS 271.37]|uniref:aldehyde dehydrogenase (NAD(+)) n=1 Tax=Fonsecaea pedrosoi CBS 271.37 TaxID=1442368 RepID=A0A0D2GMU9_9EURO|nr:uncharacterized protein Z517_06485 [Fonsecaea pedrosoi CBS 271.37]KIW79870.1 hypothetical protein Z517_06485 [Fonsecaea pedrosoi CBS 271.37]
MGEHDTSSLAKYNRKHYINGKFVDSVSQSTYTVYNPKDGTLLSDQMAIAGAEDVEKAVQAAETAFFDGPWSKFTAVQRAACLNKLADILEERLVEILILDSLASGNPISLAPTRDRPYIIGHLRYYAGWTDKMKGDYFPDDDGFLKLVRHEPLGVCAAINPFNSPIAAFFFKVAPALATGNVMIVKPSEKTPYGTFALAPLFEEAGFPPGVIQILSGTGETGSLLAEHMRIRKISFTGSIPTGKRVQIAAAKSNLKRVTLELGGKSPAVVFEDADIDNAVAWTVKAILARSGQVCVSATRVYVQSSVFDKFVKEYTSRMTEAQGKLGDPQDPEVQLGPLVDVAAAERVVGMIERGKNEAQLVTGGKRVGDSRGAFVQPTVFINPKPDAEIYKKEIFGPVAVVKEFTTEDEVIRMANDTEYGLMAGVFTQDLNRALRVSAKLDSGVVGVNCVSQMSLQAPFGGKKASGLGREFGEYALRAYTEPKTVLIK